MTAAAPPDAVAAAWAACEAQWDEPARHDALVAAVAQHACYAWAAARYRERAGEPIADRQLERIRRAATATMLATASARPQAERRSPYRSTVLLMVVLLFATIAGLVYVGNLPHHPPRPAPAAP